MLPPFDKEMTTPIVEELASKGVTLLLGQSAEGIRADRRWLGRPLEFRSTTCLLNWSSSESACARKTNWRSMRAWKSDLVAASGSTSYLQTSDPNIYAVGDAIEVKDVVSGDPTQVPLAGPANRQGRIAADNVFGRVRDVSGNAGNRHRRRVRPHGGDDRGF